jgi:hypothetical protein
MAIRDLTAADSARVRPPRRRRTDFMWLVISIGLVLIAFRAALPFIVQGLRERAPARLEAYDGRVRDIDIGLWRGAYRIDGIEIEEARRQAADAVLRQPPRRLLRRVAQPAARLAGREAHFDEPKLNLVEAAPKQSQLGTEEDWHDRLEELFPFRSTRSRSTTARSRSARPGSPSATRSTARHVNGIVTNITNVVESGKEPSPSSA